MKSLTPEQEALLALIRSSLWGQAADLPCEVDWEAVAAMAQTQGVVSFAYDGAVAVKAPVPGHILQGWRNKLLGGVVRNERLLATQDALLDWFAQAEIPAVILKGSSVARYYPQPDLRVLGDIDVLVRKADLARAREVLEANGCTMLESDHPFHLGFQGHGAHLELHYSVTELPDSPGGRAAEQEIGDFMDNIGQSAVGNHRFPVLSERNQALSLLLHMIRHMFSGGIGLRQLCDWAVYVAATDPACIQSDVVPALTRCGLLQYAKIATQTCVIYLGLPQQAASWCGEEDAEACRAFLADVFRGGNMGKADREGADSWFTDSKAMGTEQSSLKALLTRLTHLTYSHFPYVRRCRILLPFFWVFLPVRYWVRSLFGLRPYKSVTRVVSAAQQRRALYDMLKIFELTP